VTSVPQAAVSTLTRRFAAWLIDLVIVGGPFIVLNLMVSDIDIGARVYDTPAWATALGWTVGLAYQVTLVTRTGQTVGKRAAGLRVVEIDNWSTPRPSAATLRVLPQLVGLIPLVSFLTAVVYLPMLWRRDQRGLHDMLARTVVIRSNYSGTGPE
jgi:uncharacterized RDD family membrane protein YckC